MQRCPTCGEQEGLRGRPAGADIELTCLECGTSWMRGALTCRGCGGRESVTALQLIRRNTRGNQLAIVGRKQLTLCPVCDEAMVKRSLSAQQPVPEDYTSVFISGFPVTRPRSDSPSRPAPKRSPDLVSETHAKAAEAPIGQMDGGQAGAPTTWRPTVRQATEAFLNGEVEADSTALIMLGAHLGPARRLEGLKDPTAAIELEEWFIRTYRGAAEDRRETARGTIVAIVDHWLHEKWLPVDLAEKLR